MEPPYIAAAVNRSLRKLVNRITGGKVDSAIKQVGVYGIGSIGGNIAGYMRDQGAIVYVSDYDPVRVRRYRQRGFRELTTEALRECDLVVGATGGTSIGPAVLPHLKSRAILASASSRQVEIDVSWLEANTKEVDADDFDVQVVQPIKAYRKYALRSGDGTLYLIYDGYPVNFYGESLPDRIADVVLSLLFEGALAIARKSGSLESIVYEGAHVLKEAEDEISGEHNALRDSMPPL